MPEARQGRRPRRVASGRLRALALTSALIGLLGCTGDPDEAPTESGRPAADLFVSTAGSDDNACTAAAPCSTFARAYAVASPGDVIEIASGTYPSQELSADPRKRGGKAVVLRPAKGGRVVVEGDLDVYAFGVELRRLTVTDNWYAKPGSASVTFRDVDAAKFYVASASDIRVLGGRIGPSVDAVAQIKAADGSLVPPRDILIDGVTFRDFTRSTPDKHMECLHVMAVEGLVVRNSSFKRCTIFDISLKEHGETEAMRNITIEESVFGRPIDGTTAINVSTPGSPCFNVLIRKNRSNAGINVQCFGKNIRIEENELPSMNAYTCTHSGAARWDRNVYAEGVPCGPNDAVRGG